MEASGLINSRNQQLIETNHHDGNLASMPVWLRHDRDVAACVVALHRASDSPSLFQSILLVFVLGGCWHHTTSLLVFALGGASTRLERWLHTWCFHMFRGWQTVADTTRRMGACRLLCSSRLESHRSGEDMDRPWLLGWSYHQRDLPDSRFDRFSTAPVCRLAFPRAGYDCCLLFGRGQQAHPRKRHKQRKNFGYFDFDDSILGSVYLAFAAIV